MPKISVIIPVYNAQNYLERCLNSVCNQTLRDIEIICVNDCSTDESAKILQDYAKNYPNLRAINLEKNQGESVARNTGLSVARGEYLAFVDNDDEVDRDFYEKLYEKAQETDADISKGQAIEISYSGNKNVIKQLRQTDDKLLFITYWWSAIYKRSLITENNITFPIHHPLGGDILFLSNAVIAAKNLQLVEGVYYHYYRREDSGDSKILSEEKIKSALDIYQIITNNINAIGLQSNSTYAFIFHHFIVVCFYLALKAENENSKKLCAKTAINIFEKCYAKNDMESHFATTAPNLFILLQNQDYQAVEELIVKCKSRMELIISGLRARIRK